MDGDTIRLATPGGPALIRIHGIDAAERNQTCSDAAGRDWACGTAATQAMADLIGRAPVACQPLDIDRYDRIVARCTAGGRDLGAAMVEQGAAWAYVRYATDYLPAEQAARAAGRGLWAGAADSPAEWRAAQRAAPAAVTHDCAIKGNISKGGRIYHLPGSRFYDRTGIDTTSGERWFCTESQAQAAGWRPPQG